MKSFERPGLPILRVLHPRRIASNIAKLPHLRQGLVVRATKGTQAAQCRLIRHGRPSS